MMLNQKKGTYKCEVCGECGDTLSLAMKLEGWSYFEAFQRLSGRLRHVEKGIVYVLELADGCYYVGYILDLVDRMNLHFNGQGAYWTRMHPPIKVVDVYYDVTYDRENKVTEQYFVKYGRDKVRGGKYVGACLDAD
jgi:predicted GIY-YIG superfamily endonuclease